MSKNIASNCGNLLQDYNALLEEKKKNIDVVHFIRHEVIIVMCWSFETTVTV